MKIGLKIYTLFLFYICFYSNAQEQKIEHYFIDKNEDNLIVNNIVQDEIGYLWLATNKGLYQYDGISFSKKTASNCNTIFTKKDSVFIGTKEQLLIYSDKKLVSFQSKSIQKIVTINNTIYLATTQGLAIYQNNTITPLKINNTIDFSVVNDILKVDDLIYIASNNGLWTFKNLEPPIKIKQIATGSFNKLIENRKHVITFNTNGNLKIIMNNEFVETIVSRKFVSAILKNKDEIWVTTNGFGIDIYDANDYTFQRKINKYNATISDRLTTLFVDKEQAIWLGTHKNGLFKISYKNRKIDKNPILKINSVQVNFNEIIINNDKELQLKANENNISFSYKTVNLANADAIEYRYKLNENFSEWSKKNSVNFANLKAGSYQFYVQSKIGNTLSNEAHVSFVIDIPFYKKDWFYILLATTIFGFFFLMMELRFQKNKKENQQKIKDLELQNHLISLEQKALQLQMNPHFIFNVLNGIKAFGNNGEITTMNETISQLSILLRSILNNSRIDEISLKQEIKTLENYLALEQKISAKRFTFSIKTTLNHIDAEEILVPPMLVQPFIENSIKHGFQPNKKDNKIEITCKVKQRFLHCTIIDNGIGIHQSKQQKSNKPHQSVALQITKERIINLSSKHSFSIEEIKENDIIYGTKVWFKIPLKTDY